MIAGAVEAFGLILVLAGVAWGLVLGGASLVVGLPEAGVGLLGVYALPAVALGAPLLLAGRFVRRHKGQV